MNTIPVIENKLKLNKKDLVDIHLFIKLLEHKLFYTERERNIISALYMCGGIHDKQESLNFIQLCFDQGLSKQGAVISIKNVLSKAKKDKIIIRKKVNNWKLNEEFLPEDNPDKFVLKYMLHNIN